MPSTALTLQTFGGSTLDSTATIDANSTAITTAINSANLYSTPLSDSSSVANQITCALPTGVTLNYSYGLQVVVKVANTTTSTTVLINIGGLGNKTVLLQGGAAPPVNSFLAGGVYTFTFDGAAFQVQGAVSNSLLTTNNTWLGFQYINNVVTIQPTFGVPLTLFGTLSQAALSINSGNTAANYTADIIIRRPGGTQNYLASGANIQLYDTVANASSLLQRSGAQTELWVTSSGIPWRQTMVWLDNGPTRLEAWGPVANGMVDLTPDQGSFAPTVLGFVVAPTPTLIWYRVGRQVTLYIPVIQGTSNANFFSMTIPSTIAPFANAQFVPVPLGLSSDNTVPITDCGLQVGPGGYTFYHNNSATGWTASGLKSTGGFTITYLLI
jgi:hypothetical protein